MCGSGEGGAGVAVVDAVPGPPPQLRDGVADHSDDRGFRHPWCAESDVRGRVEGALVRQLACGPQQVVESVGVPGAGVDNHARDLAHVRPVFKPGLAVRLRFLELGERGEEPGGVGEVCGRRVARLAVADGVGEDGGGPGVLGES